jgi:quercetin dioxygenase-like cupin family protein
MLQIKLYVPALLCLLVAVQLYAQEGAQPAYAAAATAKFSAFPGVPECAMGAVAQGDPAKGNAVILLKTKTGCLIPWHWHTPSERLIMVSGRAKVEMKDGTPATLRAGDFLNLESKHVHQFTCLAAACMLYDVTGDAPFDIHYVDASGSEISADQALKAKPKAGTSKKKTE